MDSERYIPVSNDSWLGGQVGDRSCSIRKIDQQRDEIKIGNGMEYLRFRLISEDVRREFLW